MRARRIAEDPTYLQREAEYEEDVQRLIANSAEQRDRDVVLTVPIVFHIVHLGGSENISNAQILNQVDLLNQDFRALNADLSDVIPAFQDLIGDVEIQFELPTLDPDGNCTNGIDRIRTPETLVGDDGSKLNPWPRDKYLNVWVVKQMRDGVAGYAYYPNAWEGPIGRIRDGIIILNDYIGEIETGTAFRSTALSHEIGHYLNLAHVWGNNNGVEEGPPAPLYHMVPDCGDDSVDDTPVTRGWNTCRPVAEWDDCGKLDLSTLVYDLDSVTTSSGTVDPTPLQNALDTLNGQQRIRTIIGTASANGVSANSTKAGLFAFTGWDQGAANSELTYTNLTGSINTDTYYTFSLDPQITDLLNIDSIGFRMGRNATGARTFAVRSSVNNFATNLPINGGGNPNITVQTGNIAFYNKDDVGAVPTIYVNPPLNAYENLSAPISFRLYAWNAEQQNGSASVCSNGAPIDLFDRLNGVAGGSWTGPSATTGSYDPTSMDPGTYTYTNSGSCGNSSATVTVTEVDPPAVPTVTGADSFCTGTPIVLTSSATSGNVWNTGATTGTISVSEAGNYTVTATLNGCSSSSTPFPVTATPNFSAGTNGSMAVCTSGSAVPLVDALDGSAAAGGTWTGPSDVIDGLFDPQAMTAGDYVYTLASNGPCASISATVAITLTDAPNAGTNNTLTICSNALAAELFDRLGGSPQSGGTWSGPSATTGIYDPATMATGTYTYNVAEAGSCAASSATVVVTVTNAPAIPTISGSSSFCAGGSAILTSSSNAQNVWSPGGSTNAFITAAAPGNYTVRRTVNGCTSTSAPFALTSVAQPVAGTNGSLSVCSSGGAVPLISGLKGNPALAGTWTGPSTVTNGEFDPSMTPGSYTYVVIGNAPCANRSAIVDVSITDITDQAGTFEVDSIRVYGNSGLLENVQNYMEYSYCSNMFTKGQSLRMRAAINSTVGERANLWTEQNLQVTGIAEGFRAQCAPIADFYMQTEPIVEGAPTEPFSPMLCVGATAQFIDNSVGGLPAEWSWTFADGTPSTSFDRNPVVSFSTPGWKTVTLTATNGNGSDTKTDEYSILVGGTPNDIQGLYQESFETTTDIFPWTQWNYGNNETRFARTNVIGYTGTACAVLNSEFRNPLDFIDPNNENDYDEMISPTFDLDNLLTGTFSFRYAYSTSTTTIADATERLLVHSSTDCGENWSLLLPGGLIQGDDLINNGNNPELPTGEWTLKTFNLPQSRLAPNVRFRFRFISSAFSYNLYIDDINISGAVGIDDLSPSFFMSLYPNPTNDRFSLGVYGMDRFNTDIMITDMRGALIYTTTHRPSGTAGMEFSGRDLGLSEGMYMIRATNEAGNSTQKLIIGK